MSASRNKGFLLTGPVIGLVRRTALAAVVIGVSLAAAAVVGFLLTHVSSRD